MKLNDLYIQCYVKKKPAPADETIWLEDAKFAFLYAKYIRNSRWNEQQEQVFYKDTKSLYHYVVWLKSENQTFEHLHNFMLASKVSGSNDVWINRYFELEASSK